MEHSGPRWVIDYNLLFGTSSGSELVDLRSSFFWIQFMFCELGLIAYCVPVRQVLAASLRRRNIVRQYF
jgi:hypothetical protein